MRTWLPATNAVTLDCHYPIKRRERRTWRGIFVVTALSCEFVCASCGPSQREPSKNGPSSKLTEQDQKKVQDLIKDLQAKPKWVRDEVLHTWSDNSFYARQLAARSAGDMGPAAIPAIPALMEVLGDNRSSNFVGYYSTVNSSSAPHVADYAMQSLRKLIPVSNGYWFDQVVKRLFAPKEDEEPYRQNFLLAEQGTDTRKRIGMIRILSSYGDKAFPVLLRMAYDGNKYGGGEPEGLEETSVRALGDFGISSMRTLCDIVNKHSDWSVRRVAAITVLSIGGDHSQSWDEDSLRPLAQQTCANDRATLNR